MGKRSQKRMLGLSEEGRIKRSIKRKEEERRKRTEEQQKEFEAFLKFLARLSKPL